MSKLFYDHILNLGGVEKTIKSNGYTYDERLELWQLIDELLHHRVLGCVLEKLPKKYHQEFLDRFHTKPHDEGLLDFLYEKVGTDIKEFIKKEVAILILEIIQELIPKDRRYTQKKRKKASQTAN